MARLSTQEMREMSVVDLESYAQDHPKEGMLVACKLGEAYVKIVYGVIKSKIPNCSNTTASYSYTTRAC